MTKEKKDKKSTNQTVLEPIEYDPLKPGLTALHRAGIAGLFLHLKTMEILQEEAPDKEKQKFVIPSYQLIHDGRGLRIEFTKESFYSLMRERYRGTLTRRLFGNETHKRRQKKLAEAKQRYVYDEASEEGRPAYFDARPLLQHFDVFKAHEQWKEHTRDAMWHSYYCIYRNQIIFKLPNEGETNNSIDAIWEALSKKTNIKLVKPIYPSAFDKNLKDVRIVESSEFALLLHFWPFVTAHFTPVNLKAEKDKKTGETFLRHQYQSPVIVVPDVMNIEAFIEEFVDYLGRLGDAPDSNLYQDARFIATPLEASLAFFAAPRLARGSRAKPGTRGAEVYVFRQKPKQDKQPLVTAIINESLKPQLLNEYRKLMDKRILSLPFRAICVENLLAQPRRDLYEGFERLVDQYPLELFIATKMKDGITRRFHPRGYEMAHSLKMEFRSIEEKEKRKMSREEPPIPFLIWRIARNYTRWRACSKAEPPIDENNLKALLAKKAQKQHLNDTEEKLIKKYNASVGDVVEKLFIDFRGYREKEGFANAFTETLFRAPQSLTPQQADSLQPFYEGNDWESGRRLVLMAISAVGATASYKAVDNLQDDVIETDSEETE
jgi:CRISPR-associated protein Cmx8